MPEAYMKNVHCTDLPAGVGGLRPAVLHPPAVAELQLERRHPRQGQLRISTAIDGNHTPESVATANCVARVWPAAPETQQTHKFEYTSPVYIRATNKSTPTTPNSRVCGI